MNKKEMIVCLAAAFGGVSFADELQTVYVNDFSTRTSAEQVASANWVVTHYATNDVLLSNNHNVSASTIAMVSVYPWQDGWFKMHRGKTYADNSQNLGVWYVRDDGGNAYASYSTKIAKSQTLHAQPIYNAITSGVIRTTFDVRIPKKVHTNGARLSFTLGTRDMMVEATSKEDLVAASTDIMGASLFEAGYKVFNYNGSAVVTEAESTRILGQGWAYGSVAASTGPWPAGGEWARVVVEANLDTGTFNSRLSKLGTAHPTFETAEYGTTECTGLNFYSAYAPVTKGPITGIIFRSIYGDTGAYGKSGSYYLEDDYDDDYAFKLDNIKMEWKAPDAEDFETFYLNDFNTSRRRTLMPAGTTSMDYAVATGAMTDSYTYPASWVMPYGDYTSTDVTRQIVPDYDSKTGINGVGLDGWRRASSQMPAIYITTCGVHRVLAIVGNQKLGWLVQQFGEAPTSGKVRFEYDMRVPSKMYNSGGIYQGFFTACLGSKEDWSATAVANEYFRSGVRYYGNSDDDRNVYASFVYKGWGKGFVQSDDNLLTNMRWYRMAVTFDLDANPKTGSMTCTEIGTDPIGIDEAPASGARTLSCDSYEFKDAYKDLSLIVLGTYSGGSSKIDEAMLVTNLKVTKNVGTDGEKVIYKNDFTTRTTYLDAASATRLTANAHDRMFEGLDAWQRNNNSGLEAYVTADANPALMAAQASSTHGYYAQSIGGHYKSGTYVVQADFRVPDYWSDKDGWCDVLFGNDMLKTGTMCADPNGTYNHSSNYLLGMHLYPVSSENSTDGLYDRTRFTALSGNSYGYATDLTAGHWYRCVCTAYLAGAGDKSMTTDMALYDMGTTHPAESDATPATPIAEVSGRPLYQSKRVGDDVAHLTTVGIRFRDTANYAFWKGEESGSPVIDNIVISKIRRGFVLLFK